MLKIKKILLQAICFSAIFCVSSDLQAFPYKAPRDMYLVPGMFDLVHPVTTNSPEAQKFFNQGLTYKYAFNDDAAYWSFQKAAELDPTMAMAYWGMALALGSNINASAPQDQLCAAYDAIQKAIKNSDRITTNEKGYIQALALRYSKDPKADLSKLELAYKNAMNKLTTAYRDDLDAATLYAESIFNLNPWQLWTKEGKPVGDTLEAVEVLESVLKRAPKHIGANHYYIHAIEASKHPERALMSANRLRKLLPASGHLLHMPSHIYLLVGDYHQAAEMNKQAVSADQEYIRQFGMEGTYPLHYMSHNYYFLTRAYCLEGQFDLALQSAQELQAFYVPHFHKMPESEYYARGPQWVLMRFNKWTEVTKLKPFPKEMEISNLLLNFAKAYSFISLKNFEEAEKYTQAFLEDKIRLLPDTILEYNHTKIIATIAEHQLKAKSAYMQEKPVEAIEHLKKAVALQDSLNYNEPPGWYYSIRESLGALLLDNRMHTEAEKTFRENLDLHPRDGRSLFGLEACLRAQQKDSDAFWINKEFEEAWQHSSVPLTSESFF